VCCRKLEALEWLLKTETDFSLIKITRHIYLLSDQMAGVNAGKTRSFIINGENLCFEHVNFCWKCPETAMVDE
jgi:hypothetical protein